MNDEDIKELYKVTRSQIEHLDNTIGQRIIWLVIAQSFFFSGYAILIMGTQPDPVLMNKQKMLIILFPISAIIMNVVSLTDIISGTMYLKKLAKAFDTRVANIGINEMLPPLDGFAKLNRLKNLSAMTVPVIFTVIWVYILCT